MIGDAIQDWEVDRALRSLPPGHTVRWAGQAGGRGVFVRRDGVALQVYQRGFLPLDDDRYAGDMAPSEDVDGFDAIGYPSREDCTLASLVLWLAQWDGDVDLVGLLGGAP